MIQVSDVSLVLNRHTILSHIDVTFARGEIHGLVGRNGSGKTMLMKCISGFIRPTDGVITINGKVVTKKDDFPENMGLILETPGFLPYASGYRNLALLAELNGKITSTQIRDTMRLVGLDPDLKLHVSKYSLGMRQRLGIAQAIMEDPELLILDEPFNGLDRQGVEEMRNLLLQLKAQGKTILLASHNGEDIDLLCDHVFRMEQGVLTKVEK
jgi:ABC-2 type transport system ATP-binding protein